MFGTGYACNTFDIYVPIVMSSKEIAEFLEQLCTTTFGGGRVVTNNTETILIYDVPSWPGERTDALRQRFPHCDIDIHQAHNTSASGFAVVVSTKQQVSYYRVCISVTAALMLAVLTGFTAMTVFLAEHPDWGDINFYPLHENESCIQNDTI